MSSVQVIDVQALLSRVIFHENKVVSYRFLAHTLGVPADDAKRLLQCFFKSHKNSLSPLFVLSGVSASDGSLLVRLVEDSKLAAAERALTAIHSIHIYSLQKTIPSDSAVLFGADRELCVHPTRHSALTALEISKREEHVPEKNAPTLRREAKSDLHSLKLPHTSQLLKKSASTGLQGFFGGKKDNEISAAPPKSIAVASQKALAKVVPSKEVQVKDKENEGPKEMPKDISPLPVESKKAEAEETKPSLAGVDDDFDLASAISNAKIAVASAATTKLLSLPAKMNKNLSTELPSQSSAVDSVVPRKHSAPVKSNTVPKIDTAPKRDTAPKMEPKNVEPSKTASTPTATKIDTEDVVDEKGDDESSIDIAKADEMSSLDEEDFALQMNANSSDDEDYEWEFYRRKSRKKHSAYRRLRTKLKANQRRLEKELADAYDSEDETSRLKKEELKRIKKRAKELKAAQRTLEEERARRKAEAREKRKEEKEADSENSTAVAGEQNAAVSTPKLAPSDRPIKQARPKKKAFEIDSADEISSSDEEGGKKLAEREKRKRKFGEYFSQGGGREVAEKVQRIDEVVYKTVVEEVQQLDEKGYTVMVQVRKRVVDEVATKRQAELRAKQLEQLQAKSSSSGEIQVEPGISRSTSGTVKTATKQGNISAFFGKKAPES